MHIGSPTLELMSVALKLFGNFYPGPSLLPFAALRSSLSLSSVVLRDASCALEDEIGPEPPRDFQLCWLQLLLKKQWGADQRCRSCGAG